MCCVIPVRVCPQPGSASPHLHAQLVHLFGGGARVSMQLNWGALRQASPRASNRFPACERCCLGTAPRPTGTNAALRVLRPCLAPAADQAGRALPVFGSSWERRRRPWAYASSGHRGEYGTPLVSAVNTVTGAAKPRGPFRTRRS